MDKILLTELEIDKLWRKCEKSDPLQKQPFEEVIIKAQLKKVAKDIKRVLPKRWFFEDEIGRAGYDGYMLAIKDIKVALIKEAED